MPKDDLVGNCRSTIQAPESGGTVSRKYAKFLTTSKSLNFVFRRNLWGIACEARKREAEHGPGNSLEYRDQIRSWKAILKKEEEPKEGEGSR